MTLEGWLSLRSAVLLLVLPPLTFLRHTRLERRFAFALIVSALYRDRIENTHDHLQSRGVDYRHQIVYRQILALVDHAESTFGISGMTMSMNLGLLLRLL